MPGDDHHANMTPQKEAVKTNQAKEIAKFNNGAIKVDVELQFVETSVGRSHVPRGYVLAWWYQWRIVNHVEVGTPLTVIILASFKILMLSSSSDLEEWRRPLLTTTTLPRLLPCQTK